MAGRASSYADRRRAAADRLSRSQDLASRLSAAVDPAFDQASDSPIDPDGVLRASVRALVPLAYRNPAFDVTVSLGPDQVWAVRVRHGQEGLVAELVPGQRSAGTPRDVSGSETRIAAELAAWLWNGEVAR
jgi:hypothetical protein